MKKLKLVGILVAVVLIGSVISIPLINNHTAYKVEKALCEIPLPEGTELIIRSDLSLEELDAYYSGYRSNEWECLVETQEGQSIEVIDHETLQFSEEIKDSGYYILYSWGSGNSLLEELDIRGH